MPKLLIRRDSGYADSLRKYKILLDGDEIGSIASGKIEEFEISSGQHTLQAKIDSQSSSLEAFTAEEEPISFEVVSKLRGFKVFGAIFFLFVPRGWIKLNRI